jgi:cytidylate kinase
MIVTIDGPAGSGKSTAARGLAARLGFEYLDTGAMFRAVALALHRADISPADTERVRSMLAILRLEMPRGRVILNGEDVSTAIRSVSMSSASSKVAVVPQIRAYLAVQQRAVAEGRNMVCEGRDQGTAVFPDACCKFFLSASLHARAERRLHELIERGEKIALAQVEADLVERDHRDSSREVAPLRAADDAIHIDTSDLTPEQVLDRMEKEVRQCRLG